MITEKKYCKKCGQQIDFSKLSMLWGKNYVELDDGVYCIECGRAEVKRRRGK